MSTMAYGWVEGCNDIAGCETTPLQDKYFLYLTLQCIYFMSYYEHDERVELYLLPLCI